MDLIWVQMKERVLDFLMAIAKGKHELIAVYANELDTSEEEIIKRGIPANKIVVGKPGCRFSKVKILFINLD